MYYHTHMPIDLVLIRHGESEGNLAQERSQNGDQSDWKHGFGQRHTSHYRLTEFGRYQAQVAGQWIKKNISKTFDHYYCSGYIRAMETAALLKINRAKWDVDFYLRERDQGVLGGISRAERQQTYGDEIRRRDLDTFYWAAPGGESIANSCMRVDQVIRQLAESFSGFRVALVCHGNIMLAFRIRLERMKQQRFRELLKNPQHKICNGHVLHYTRRDPENGEIHAHLSWVRSVCPWDLSLSSNDWCKIQPPLWSNEELLAEANQTPQIVNRRSLQVSAEENIQRWMEEKSRSIREDEDEQPEMI